MLELTRRNFMAGACAATAAMTLSSALTRAQDKPKWRKAMIVGKIDEAGLTKFKEAGFDGVETTNADSSVEDAAKGKAIADKLGMKIHSVMRAWMEFNSKDPARVAATIAKTETSLKAAQAFGADAILLVPCRIGGTKAAPMPIPEAWDFQIEFDEANGHLKQVVKGDNSKYQTYIEAHNHATDTSTEAIKKLIPVAEKTGVVIGLENVWNNLWVKPAIFKHFVASFKSPWVKAYFDIGNHVKYAPSHEFVKELGSLVCKCHVKDFKLNADGKGGTWAQPRDGSVDWPAVTRELAAAGYNGWFTFEGGGLTPGEYAKRIDLIMAGK